MSTKNRRYTLEFKQEALALLESSGQSITTIERELGITHGLLSKWRRGLGMGSHSKTINSQPLTDKDKEIQHLKRENARLKQERDILKKVVAIFAPENR